MRRWAYRVAVVVAVAAMAAGGGYALAGYRSAPGPAATVAGYFAALARADAPGALAYGPAPGAPHQFLTSAVLAEQQRIAPLHGLAVTALSVRGATAVVGYSYRLRFASGDRAVSGRIGLTRRGRRWQLDSTSVVTTVTGYQAGDRMSFAGTALPAGPVALFPGALPVRFDTAYLGLAAADAAVRLGQDPSVELLVEPSAAARSALRVQLAQRLAACLRDGFAAVSCPLPSPPSGSYVPGTLHGRVTSDLGALSYRVGTDAAGVITVTGTVRVRASYRLLDYQDVVAPGQGTVALPVDASAYAVAPLSLRLTGTGP